MKRWTIYCHTHIATGRRYVGLTSQTMERRWASHCAKAKSAKGGRWHFPNAIRKYGKDAFSHEVLEVCYDLEVANLAEKCWIDLFETRDPTKGFNLAKGGSHTPHPIRKNPWDRPEFREKALANLASANARATHSGRSTRSKEVNSRPEVRAKMSAATSKQFASPESRQKQAELVSSFHQDPELREKLAAGLRRANERKAARACCYNGHEYTDANTRIDRNGWRHCRKCAADKVSAAGRANRTRCPSGHALSGDNVSMTADGRRTCVACRPRVCARGHSLLDKPPTFHGRGCHRCKMEREKTRRLLRAQGPIGTVSICQSRTLMSGRL